MTKKIILIASFTFILGFALGNLMKTKESLAVVSLQEPTGGTVAATQIELAAEIVCNAAIGPFTISPLVNAPTGPYFVRFNRSSTPSIGSKMLGLYTKIPDVGTCYNPETGAPIPAFELTRYGASR